MKALRLKSIVMSTYFDWQIFIRPTHMRIEHATSWSPVHPPTPWALCPDGLETLLLSHEKKRHLWLTFKHHLKAKLVIHYQFWNCFKKYRWITRKESRNHLSLKTTSCFFKKWQIIGKHSFVGRRWEFPDVYGKVIILAWQFVLD